MLRLRHNLWKITIMAMSHTWPISERPTLYACAKSTYCFQRFIGRWPILRYFIFGAPQNTRDRRELEPRTGDRRPEICKRGDDDGQNPIVASYFRIATPSGCSLMGSISGLDESTAIAEQAPKSALRETRGVAAKTPIFERNVGRRRRSTLR